MQDQTSVKSIAHAVSRRSVILTGAAVTSGLVLAPVWAMPSAPKPRVAVLEHRDGWTGLDGAGELLRLGGCEVVTLDPSKPADEQGVDAIVFGSFSSESQPYQTFMSRHARSVGRFVNAGGVVLQFTQADQNEASPPFLPEGLEAHRNDADPGRVLALRPGHPLLTSMLDDGDTPPRVNLPPHQRTGGWESIDRFDGFAVLAAESTERTNAVILEGAHGRGRFLITALHFDRLFDAQRDLAASPAFFNAAKQFAGNFRAYVSQVKAGRAPDVVADEPYKPADPVAYTAGAWTIAVLPDTQVYSQAHPQHFLNQTQWIVDQAEALKIQHVLHLGDVVNRGYQDPKQWDVADQALSTLVGRVPLGVVPGNHDYDDNSGQRRTTYLNTIMPPQKLARGNTLVELYNKDKVDNQALAFTIEGQKWLMLGLEFGPRDGVMAWAKDVLKKYEDHHAIVFTHAYMYSDETRYDHTTKEQNWNPSRYNLEDSFNDGEMMWQKAFRDAPNVRMVLNGHVLNDGQAYLASEATAGHTVHQMLQNYQTQHEGGEGYMRLFEFQPDGRTVQAKTYSPSVDKYKTDPANQFTFTL